METADAEFQILLSLLTNRRKRHQRGQFVIQGVRPLTEALRAGWPMEALLVNQAMPASAWARSVIETTRVRTTYLVAPHLMSELAGKEGPVELLGLGAIPARRLVDVPVAQDTVVLALDRPASPGNLGTIVRSADALGA